MGVSAWAAVGDVTTNVNIDFSNAIVEASSTPKYSIAGTISSLEWDEQWTTNPSVADGMLRIGNFTGKAALVGEVAGSRDVVTITFDLGLVALSGKETFRFYIYDTDGTKIAGVAMNKYNGTMSDNGLNLVIGNLVSKSADNPGMIADTKNEFTIKVDYAQHKILTTVVNKNDTYNYEADLATSTKPVGAVGVGGNGSNGNRLSYFDNLKVTTTEGNYEVATADYTVKFVCNGTEIKTAATRNGEVGASISASSTDKATFFADASETQRYIYVSDDAEGKTIASDGTTVLTVTYREAAKYDWTVTTSYDETVLPYAASGSVWEDLNTVYVTYPRYQVSGTQLVQKTPNGNDLRQSITVDKDGFTSDFAYSEVEGVDNIYLLSEAEELGTGLAKNGTSFTTRVSNGQIIYGSAGTLLTLPAGKYIFTLGTIGGDTGNHQVAYTVSAGSTQIASGTCTGNFLTNIVSSGFTLTGTTPITFTCSDPSSSRGIDLVYVQKTGDVELPATVAATLGANGYSTFASVYDLDLSSLSGVKAYTATLSGKDLSFSECTDKVVAGTGLLLKGAADAEVALPVISTGAAAVDGNALTGVTAATELQSNAEGNYIFVMKKAAAASDELTFLPLSTTAAVTVPAGKAYVTVPATAFADGARALSISFGDETTGISQIENAQSNEAVYNLSGQRVMQPSKGLYIVNGKKVIINK